MVVKCQRQFSSCFSNGSLFESWFPSGLLLLTRSTNLAMKATVILYNLIENDGRKKSNQILPVRILNEITKTIFLCQCTEVFFKQLTPNEYEFLGSFFQR